MIVGYHASHEQFSPSDLLLLVSLAESSGFRAVQSSDHFHPWSESQGHSGFAWSWLGAALARTSLPFSVVSAPGYRYHPAIVAQAAATLAEMFPGRFSVAVGSGEALNEGITGEKWPLSDERNERLRECIDIIRDLWAGKVVTYKGHVVIEEAKLYVRPQIPPLLIGAAIKETTARWMAPWVDGMVTTARPVEMMKKIVEAFRSSGGEGKPMYLKLDLSYARSEQNAVDGAWDQWRTQLLGPSLQADLRTPSHFDAVANYITREQVREKYFITNDTRSCIGLIQSYFDLGYERVYLHNVNKEQEQFIEDFGQKVLPAFK